jgi:hydrogenase nickel incorporation protein HypB
MSQVAVKDQSGQNGKTAAKNRADFDAAGTTVITLVGRAGAGKTSLIEAILLRMSPPIHAAAIIGNLVADRQISRITRHGYQAVPIKTDSMTAAHVRDVLPQLDLPSLDLLFIEADSNSLNPTAFDLGQHLRIGAFSVAGGDDKVNEFPSLVAASDLVLLSKVDLLPIVTFDLKAFTQDIARLKAAMPMLPISVQSGQGIDDWRRWIEAHLLH